MLACDRQISSVWLLASWTRSYDAFSDFLLRWASASALFLSPSSVFSATLYPPFLSSDDVPCSIYSRHVWCLLFYLLLYRTVWAEIKDTKVIYADLSSRAVYTLCAPCHPRRISSSPLSFLLSNPMSLPVGHDFGMARVLFIVRHLTSLTEYNGESSDAPFIFCSAIKPSRICYIKLKF